jgi:hypothetical protein
MSKIRIKIKIKSENRGLGRFGTDVGTDKMCKIINVYRPWDGGTDKLGRGGVGQLRLKLKANRIKALLFARPDTTIQKR